MKLFTLLAAAVSMILAGIGFAADTKATTYTVGMTGVTWAGCKTHVREAFAKLDGIDKSTIKIEAGEKEGAQKVTFKSTSAKLKKEDAVKSLGENARKYVVVTFAPEKDN